jgi:Na+/melibiose symporter-like transporter
MNTLVAVLVPLVDKVPDPADVKPGWLGFGVFLALAVAVALLWFSMRKQLRKVDFEEEPDAPKQPRTNGDEHPTPA